MMNLFFLDKELVEKAEETKSDLLSTPGIPDDLQQSLKEAASVERIIHIILSMIYFHNDFEIDVMYTHVILIQKIELSLSVIKSQIIITRIWFTNRNKMYVCVAYLFQTRGFLML